MDNNEVYTLFEDIKNNLKDINGKLENASKVANDQASGLPPAVDLTSIKEVFDNSAKEHQQQTKAILTKFGEAEVYASNRILSLLRNLKDSFVRSSEGRKNEPQEHIHRHQFDIKSNKVFSLLVGMGIVCSQNEIPSHRSISTVINSTSSPTRYFLFWSAWVSYVAFPSGATSSFGNPSVSMRTMR